ncbi:MAG TPA: PTS sugar transporter subunit IIA [Planctomycetota bacterium]|nr:PTS sugar transporter subunit IIA [Planctomycetota bacterium]
MQLSVRDAARLLNATERAVHRWIKERGLPHYKVQEQTRFNRVELLEWATGQGIAISPEVFQGEAADDSSPRLSEALEIGGIHHGIPGDDQQQVLRALVSVLRLPPDVDREFVCAALMARKNAGSTGIGGGIAIPHVRNPVILRLSRAQACLAFLRKPIDFGAMDGKPVVAVFALFCPTVRTHLRLLSRLAYVLRDDSLRKAIERQAPQDEILSLVRAEEEKLQSARSGGAWATASPE